MSKLILEQETHQILGACFEVYKEKGCGFVEPVYQECLEQELASRAIEFLAQKEIG
jgi:GxxExxY protein